MNRKQWIVWGFSLAILGGFLKVMASMIGYNELGYFTWLPGWIFVWLGIVCWICAYLEKEK